LGSATSVVGVAGTALRVPKCRILAVDDETDAGRSVEVIERLKSQSA
jgi:hypothetical protein